MFALNIEAVLTSNFNICLKKKHKTECIPLYTPVLQHKSWVSGSIRECYEPLQKLRVRLGACKTGLSPPVNLCY